MKKGISLIVLVITIIVIIILVGAVILSLSDNNPITSANKAIFLSDLSNFKTDLAMFETKQIAEDLGVYKPTLLQANEASVKYDGNIVSNITINDLIQTLGKTNKYAGLFEVINGELVFKGNDTNQKKWAVEAGTEVAVAGEPIINIITPQVAAIAPGTDAIFTVKFTSNVALSTIDLTNKIEVTDDAGIAITNQPNIVIGTVSGSNLDNSRQVDITVKTDSLTIGSYKLKIKALAVTNADNISNTIDILSLTVFDILDSVPPTNPTMIANPSVLTNTDVSVIIIYSSDSSLKEYSFDSNNWNTYTSDVIVTTNNTTVYSRGKDASGNISLVSSITILNIDKIEPTVVFGTNGGTILTTASTTVTVNDLNGVNVSTLQYVWNTQNITTPTSGWVTFTNGQTLTKTAFGTYYLWIKGSDNLGNIVTVKSNSFIITDVTSPITTTQTENKTFAGLTTGFSYDNPVIPAGFVAINSTDASWNNLSTDYNNGLIIQDSGGNQFVWVPVDGVNVTYAKWCTAGRSYTATTDDTTPIGFIDTNITTTYKGFYIARYESMFDYNGGIIRMASKKSLNKTSTVAWYATRTATYDGYLWNYINYTDSKLYAENMDTSYSYDTTKVGTNLITGTQWDTIMKWVQNSGKSVINSRAWGNHSNSISPANTSGYMFIQVSGYSNYWKAKNIYDLSGNMCEWSSEFYSSTYPVTRGGAYSGPADTTNSSSDRDENTSDDIRKDLSFRVCLYIL